MKRNYGSALLVLPSTARWRIVGWIVLTVALVVLALILTARSVFLHQIYVDANSAIVQEVREFNAFASEAVDSRTRRPFTSLTALMERYLERQTPDSGETFIAITPGDILFVDNAGHDAGERLAGNRDLLSTLLADANHSGVIQTEDGELRWGKSIVRGNNQQGVFLVGQFLQDGIDGVHRSMLMLFGVMLVGMLLTASIAWLVAGQILAPVRRFARVSARVGPHDLKTRLPEDGENEMAALARSINGMLDRLTSAHMEQRHVLSEVLQQIHMQTQLLNQAQSQEGGLEPALLDAALAQLRALTQDLSLLIDSGKGDFLHRREVQLDDLMHQLAQQLRHTYPQRRWHVKESLKSFVNMDPARITQGLHHLASNAVAQTQTDETIELGTSLRQQADGQPMVSLWMLNHGPHLDQEQAKAIFATPDGDATDASQPRMGMGLAVVKALAHAHGGYAWVESSQERGTVFGIDIPLLHEQDPFAQADAATQAMQQEQ